MVCSLAAKYHQILHSQPLIYNTISCLLSHKLVCPQVSAVPTVIAMQGGDVIARFVGLKDDDELDSFVTKIIGQ